MNRTAIHTPTISAAPARGVVVRNRWARNLVTFLMVFGPGPIVMEADNDAGAGSRRYGDFLGSGGRDRRRRCSISSSEELVREP